MDGSLCDPLVSLGDSEPSSVPSMWNCNFGFESHLPLVGSTSLPMEYKAQV